MIRRISITQLAYDSVEITHDDVPIEYSLTLYLNGEEWVTLLCSPYSLEFLVCGFMKSEGLIKGREDMEELVIDSDRGQAWIRMKNVSQIAGRRTYTSGFARGITSCNVMGAVELKPCSAELRVHFEDLTGMMDAFNVASPAFKATGGVHSCAICSSKEMLLFQEDIGRNNAIDKLIGEALIMGVPTEDKVLLTSCRISSEILMKAAHAGFPMIVSRAAPTDMAVREAEKLNITLLGFVRGTRGNVYAGKNRIITGS